MDKRKLRFFYIYSVDLKYGKSKVESVPAAPAVQLHALAAPAIHLHALAAHVVQSTPLPPHSIAPRPPRPAEQHHSDVWPAQVSQLRRTGQDKNCAHLVMDLTIMALPPMCRGWRAGRDAGCVRGGNAASGEGFCESFFENVSGENIP